MFQKDLRALVAALEDKQDKIAEAGGVADQIVEYQLGFYRIEEKRITLYHDDVLLLMAQLLLKPKFRRYLLPHTPSSSSTNIRTPTRI